MMTSWRRHPLHLGARRPLPNHTAATRTEPPPPAPFPGRAHTPRIANPPHPLHPYPNRPTPATTSGAQPRARRSPQVERGHDGVILQLQYEGLVAAGQRRRRQEPQAIHETQRRVVVTAVERRPHVHPRTPRLVVGMTDAGRYAGRGAVRYGLLRLG